MPVNGDGSLRAFIAPEIAAMQIRTFDVRGGAHPTYTREVDQNTMTRSFLVAWDQRYNFCEHLCGRSKTWDDAGTTRLSRLLPNAIFGQDPNSPETVFATRITRMCGHGAGRDDGVLMPAYSDAQVDVFYEAPNFTSVTDGLIVSETDRFISFRPGPTEPRSIGPFPGGAFKYTTPGGAAPHGTPIPYGVEVQRVVTRFVLTHHDVPYEMAINGGSVWNRTQFGEKVAGVPDGISYVATVNRNDLTIGSVARTWAAGTLLLERVETFLERRQGFFFDNSRWRWRVEYHYAYTPRGWLNLVFWNPAAPGQSDWLPVSNDGVYYTPQTIPDRVGVYNARAHELLFDPNY